MSVTGFKRGVPTYKDKDDNEYGLLCETKEVCVTDNDGVSLEYKLQTLMQNIDSLTSELQSCVKTSEINYIKEGTTQVGNAKTLDGHGAEFFAKGTDLSNYLPITGGTITTDSNSRLPQLPLSLVNGVNENGSVVRYDDKKGTLGHLGFVEKNKPIFSDVNGNVKDILHTGNSAKVVVSETAPSDTSALWVW